MDLNELHMKSSFLTIQRKWNRLPKFLRFYLLVIIIFITFTFSYYILFISKKIVDNQNELPSNIVNGNHNDESSKSNLVEDQLNNNLPPPPPFPPEPFNLKRPEDLIEIDKNDKYLTKEEFKLASLKQNEKQKAIQEAIIHSWNGYHKYAWGQDMLRPITKKSKNWFGIGLTILDSLDTLIIAGLDDEYKQAMEWIENKSSFDVNQNVNCFETTIRALAGLLSAYHLSKDNILLEKSIDLGSRLIHCFDSPIKTVPYSDVNLKTRIAKAPDFSTDSSLSEVSSVQLEFRDLSRETGDESFEEKSFLTSKHIHELIVEERNNDYLLPMYISPISGHLVPSTITLGARADSYYEYLYKQYAQTGIKFFLDDYIHSIQMIKQRLMRSTNGKLNLTYIGELIHSNPHSVHPKMDHLVCFLSGTLALGYYHHNQETESSHLSEKFAEHFQMAKDLARTCQFMYNLTETGLSPEIAYFGINEQDAELYIKPLDTHNLLRPEYVESLFFLYHITNDPQYRKWGWEVFEAFNKYSRCNSGGYTTINDVRHPQKTRPRDLMESYWIAETLKYLYLLFMDDKKIVYKMLNYYIFNTEAHLLPRRIKS